MSSEQLTGVLERIIFSNEETHFTIAEFRAGEDNEKTTITGALPGVQCGETLHLTGEWTRHSQHGLQFKIASFRSTLPSTVYGIRKYLGSGLVPGVGKVYANKIVDAFGTDTFRVLSEESGRLRNVPGIGKKRASSIKSAWDDQRAFRELYIFLQTYGVTTGQCVKLHNAYGAQAQTILTTEPYRVAREIDGIGFKTADKIAINLGFANDAAPRLDAGLLYAMETLQEEGHTAIREADLIAHTAELLESAQDHLEPRIAALLESRHLIRHWPEQTPDPLPGSGFIQLPILHRAEAKIADVVQRITAVNSGLPPIKIDAAVNWAQEKASIEFAAKQSEGIRTALSQKFSILTGGPGTGKAQPVHAQVLTPSGFRPIGKLRPGDSIVTPEGGLAQINSTHPQGRKSIYEVEFVDGRSCECCDDHLWKVWTRTSIWSPAKKKKIRSRGWRVVPLHYIRKRIEEQRTESDRLAIPLLETDSHIADADLPIDPYLLGALIGDGTLTDAVLFTTVDDELRTNIERRINEIGLTLKNVRSRGAPTITWRIIGRGSGHPNPLRDAIVSLGLNTKAESKFVPACYFTGSTSQRQALLQGLLDTDGTVDKLGVISFTTSSPQLAKDVQKLAWSLGCIATFGAVKSPIYDYRGEQRTGLPAFTLFLQHPQPAELLSLSRKVKRTVRSKPRTRISHRLRIKSIKRKGSADCVCISVDSPSGLYVTDNYIVTHNTTILRALVDILRAKKVRVHLAAPTGRAAQRLAETTGGFASTIHRLLKFDPSKGHFTTNEDHPLATDFLIVDEASMLDTRLASALLQAVPAAAHLLLVGDTDQLPSVGAGNVLQDLIATQRVAVTRLDVIHRQKGQSGIVTTAHGINSGDPTLPPTHPEMTTIPVWSDLNFIPASDQEDCVRKVMELCRDVIPRTHQWVKPREDIQVLAPMHRGTAGVANFNLRLQEALNPGRQGIKFGSTEFRPGDKIIQLRNNYDKSLFNGDIGIVVSTDGVAGTLDAQFDSERHTFERGEFGDLALAYAITIHKSQGSEYPVVVIPLMKAHFMMLQRNLLYTAITRGKKKVYLVGEPAAYGMAVRNHEAKVRSTHLKQKIAATG